MNNSTDQTDAQLTSLMDEFGERLNGVFAFFCWALELKDDKDLHGDPTQNARTWRMRTIENACLDTTLIALRDLDDFLIPRTPKTKPEDVRASDFGYKGSHDFLTQSEREKINKLIAHTTTVGEAGFDWVLLELATKGISQSLTFLKWVEKKWVEKRYDPYHFYSSARVIRERTESRFTFITREAEKRRVSDPLEELLAMPLKKRIAAIAEDVRTKKDRYARIDAFALADALEVEQPESPTNEWVFTHYAEKHTLEEYAESVSDYLFHLEDQVSEKRFEELKPKFEGVDLSDPNFDFLTPAERLIIEEAVAARQLEINKDSGICCVASYSVGKGTNVINFEGSLEDDGSCELLRTPYDERDGRFKDLSDCVTEVRDA